MLLVGIFRIFQGIVDDRDPHIKRSAGDEQFASGPINALPWVLEKFRRQGIARRPAQIGAIRPEYLSEIRAA